MFGEGRKIITRVGRRLTTKRHKALTDPNQACSITNQIEWSPQDTEDGSVSLINYLQTCLTWNVQQEIKKRYTVYHICPQEGNKIEAWLSRLYPRAKAHGGEAQRRDTAGLRKAGHFQEATMSSAGSQPPTSCGVCPYAQLSSTPLPPSSTSLLVFLFNPET